MEMGLRMAYLLNIKKSFVIITLSLRGSSIHCFFLFFSQYLQDESKTKRNVDLNLLEWTHYSLKPHVSAEHLYFNYFVALTVRGILLMLDFLPPSPHTHP